MKKLLVILLVLGLAAPAMAAEWNFYGSARMTTFWEDFDAEDLEDIDPDDPFFGEFAAQDDEGLVHALQGNSRIGARVKVNDQIGGRFEYGTGVNVRLLYGTYDFGGGKLLVGQDYTPGCFFYSNSVYAEDGDLLGVGQFYGHRYGQIKLMMGGFSVAAISPTTSESLGGDVDVTLPKIEAAYSFKSDAFFIDAFGGYQTYEVEDVPVGADETEDLDIDSWVLGVGGGVTLGPVNLMAAVSFAQNLPVYQPVASSVSASSGAISGPALEDDDVADGETLQACLVAVFKASDTLAFEAGVGYANHENDADDLEDVESVDMQYYINAVVTIAPGFFVVPEIGMIETDIDSDDDDADGGQTTYFGLKWQINF